MTLRYYPDIVEIPGGGQGESYECIYAHPSTLNLCMNGLNHERYRTIERGDETNRLVELPLVRFLSDYNLHEDLLAHEERKNPPVRLEEITAPAQRRQLYIERNDVDERHDLAACGFLEPVCFEVDGKTVGTEPGEERNEEARLLERLAPRHAHRVDMGMHSGQGPYKRHELARIDRIIRILDVPQTAQRAPRNPLTGFGGVAVVTAAAAPGGSHEYLENPHVESLALDREENLRDVTFLGHHPTAPP